MGGLGSQNDSLLRFKFSFSKDFRDFKVWIYIVNPSKYYELAESNFNIKKFNKNSFSPLYLSRTS